MRISEEGRGGGVFLLKEWSTHSLSRGLVMKLSDRCSVCWFWFRLSQTRKWSPEEMGLLV